MFRIIQAESRPTSYPVDPSGEFQPGQVAQLGVNGNNIVCGVSDGTAPFGIIDDIKTNAFTAPSIDEEVIATSVPSVAGPSGPVAAVDVIVPLDNPNITEGSFASNPVDVVLNSRNGVVTFIAGTPLNIDLDGDGIFDAIRTVVNYTYQVPNVPGDDSTIGSGKVTVWFSRMIVQTDQFETNQRYPINGSLFVSESGLFTTRQPDPTYPSIAMVTGSPNAILGSLELIWF